jgi:hypothetical protein
VVACANCKNKELKKIRKKSAPHLPSGNALNAKDFQVTSGGIQHSWNTREKPQRDLKRKIQPLKPNERLLHQEPITIQRNAIEFSRLKISKL